MKIEEALDYLEDPIGKSFDVHREALKVAREALEKQIAKKPIPGSSYLRRCPICNFRTTIYRENFCGTCGQKLDWGKDE